MRIEIRADSVVIEGYVNAVARDSRPMRDRKTGKRFVEQIVPGVFERALKHNEVQLLLNHDKTRNLGSTSTNLELYEDSIGLHARAEVPDPEVIEKARKKKLRGWSFGFRLSMQPEWHARKAKEKMTPWNAETWRIWTLLRYPL